MPLELRSHDTPSASRRGTGLGGLTPGAGDRVRRPRRIVCRVRVRSLTAATSGRPSRLERVPNEPALTSEKASFTATQIVCRELLGPSAHANATGAYGRST